MTTDKANRLIAEFDRPGVEINAGRGGAYPYWILIDEHSRETVKKIPFYSSDLNALQDVWQKFTSSMKVAFGYRILKMEDEGMLPDDSDERAFIPAKFKCIAMAETIEKTK